MLNKVADWLIQRAQRTPYIHLDGYMNRWWLVPYNKWGFAARIHQILRSDTDRHYHDHPWAYISIVLRGGYWELTPRLRETAWGLDIVGERRRWRGPGSVAFRSAKSWHKLQLPTWTRLNNTGCEIENVPCWTLFITFPKTQSWGFLVEGTKVLWRDYLGDKAIDTNYFGEES